MTETSHLRARYHATEATLEGSGDDLARLAEVLRAHADATIALDVPAEPAAPYDAWFARIDYRPHAGERVLIARDGDALVVSGYHEAFADNIAFASGEPVPGHHHEEWYEDHFYLDRRSLPLVVECSKET